MAGVLRATSSGTQDRHTQCFSVLINRGTAAVLGVRQQSAHSEHGALRTWLGNEPAATTGEGGSKVAGVPPLLLLRPHPTQKQSAQSVAGYMRLYHHYKSTKDIP